MSDASDVMLRIQDDLSSWGAVEQSGGAGTAESGWILVYMKDGAEFTIKIEAGIEEDE